jgi:hypothetical protein
MTQFLDSIDLKQCTTLDWFDKSMQAGIPADQSSLLAMFIRNLNSRLDETGKDEMQIRQLLKLMSISNQTLIEPIFTELNTFCNQSADTQITLKHIKDEKADILNKSERRSLYYIYALLGLTMFQWIAFYWTIFHVDWLGKNR